jgi:hypothetical protein
MERAAANNDVATFVALLERSSRDAIQFARRVVTELCNQSEKKEEGKKKMPLPDDSSLICKSPEPNNKISESPVPLESKVDIAQKNEDAERTYSQFHSAKTLTRALHVPLVCAACERPARLRCSQCKTAKYCSTKCQTQHWKRHKV